MVSYHTLMYLTYLVSRYSRYVLYLSRHLVSWTLLARLIVSRDEGRLIIDVTVQSCWWIGTLPHTQQRRHRTRRQREWCWCLIIMRRQAFLWWRSCPPGQWGRGVGHGATDGGLEEWCRAVSWQVPTRGEVMRAKAEWAEEVRVERVRAIHALDKLAYQTYNYCTQQGALNCGEQTAMDCTQQAFLNLAYHSHDSQQLHTVRSS